MAKSLNRVTLIGNLGSDPEIRSTPQGRNVTTLSIATTESYKDRNEEWQEVTDWHRVVLWDRLANLAKDSMKKGSKIYVEGKLKTRKYEDKTGVTRYVTEIMANNVVLCFPKDNSQYKAQNSESIEENNINDSDDFDSEDKSDDLPF